jgi:hypothetical protein
MLQLVYDFDTYDRPMYTHFHYSLYMKLATSCQLRFVLMQLVVQQCWHYVATIDVLLFHYFVTILQII